MKLTEKIHLLRIDFEITLSPGKKLPRFVNAILIFGDKITLIDTGVKGKEEKIFECIVRNNREISEIETLILSHSHPDHIGSAARIKELTGCEVLAHELEKEWIENIEIQNKHRPVPGFFNLVDQPVMINENLKDGQELQIDKDITLDFIHSPGHSKGLLNISFREDKILFTADSIPLKNDIPNYDDYPDLMQSLKRIKNNKDYSTLLTSWTPALTNSIEIDHLIKEGEDYMMQINKAVKEVYVGNENSPLAFCKAAVDQLGLPVFFVNPIVDKAFRSHIK